MQITTRLSTLATLPLIGIIRIYQLFISTFLGQNCRFYPTCSCYAHQALTRHGIIKGGALAIKRIVKCQPMHPGGVDEVPDLVIKKETVRLNNKTNKENGAAIKQNINAKKAANVNPKL